MAKAAGSPGGRSLDGTEPITDYNSKKVMLRAERHDRIRITDIVDAFDDKFPIPDEFTVLERTTPYYGPRLILHAEIDETDENYFLQAAGPDTYLMLWYSITDKDGFRKSWKKLAEVKSDFADAQPQYDICPDCGYPMQTIEHERASAFGHCPGQT